MESQSMVPMDRALDPTLFAINWDVTIEVLIMIIVLSFVFERALAMLFESDSFLAFEKRRDAAGKGSFKSGIAFVVSALGCYLWDFDALSILLQREHMTTLGEVITGAVVAGGSKASMKLFHDVMDAKSSAYRRKEEAQQSTAENSTIVVAPIQVVPAGQPPP